MFKINMQIKKNSKIRDHQVEFPNKNTIKLMKRKRYIFISIYTSLDVDEAWEGEEVRKSKRVRLNSNPHGMNTTT